MTKAPRFLALAVIAVLAGLGLWLVLQVTGSPGGVPNPPGPGPVLVEVVEPTPVEVAEPGDEIADLTSDLEVAIEVRIRARILPSAPSPETEILRVAGDRVSRAAVLTRPGGPALVEFTLRTGEHVYRVMNLDDPQPMFFPEVDLRGRVVDEGGDPVAGAEVWYGQGERGQLLTETTDAEGVFAVPSLVGGRGIPVMVTARGRASRYLVVDLDGSVYREPLFVLEPGVALRVQIAGDMWTSQARVFLAPAVRGDTTLQQFPFFLGTLENGWEVNRNGEVLIHGLPVGSQLEVTAQHPLAVTPPPVLVRVRPRDSVTVAMLGSRLEQLSLRRLSGWTGRVVDSAGEPISGALVLGRREGKGLPKRRHSPRWLLPADVQMIDVAHDWTDQDGRFAVAEASFLHISAPGYAGLELLVQDQPLGDIVLYEPRAGQPALRIHVPDCSNSYRIHCRPYANEWRTLACGTPFVLELPEPSVVDISVQIRRDGVVSEPRVFTGLVVQGVAELDLR